MMELWSTAVVSGFVGALAGYLWGLSQGYNWRTPELERQAKNLRHNQWGELDL